MLLLELLKTLLDRNKIPSGKKKKKKIKRQGKKLSAIKIQYFLTIH